MICGLAKTQDVEVFCAMSCLDPENQQGFGKLQRMAMETTRKQDLWFGQESNREANGIPLLHVLLDTWCCLWLLPGTIKITVFISKKR